MPGVEYDGNRTITYRSSDFLNVYHTLVAEIEGVDGIEVVFPHEVSEASTLLALVARYHLNIAAVNVNVKSDADFRDGGLTATNSGTRAKAVRFIKEAKSFAKAVGANKVTCCPLADGYEFSFHCNYRLVWGYLVETIAEAASYLPGVPLFIEYKPNETRGRCFVDSAAKTLCPVARSRYPFYVHINDNDGAWD